MLLRTIVEALQERQRLRRAKKSRRRSAEGEAGQSSGTTTSTPLAYALARSWAWPALKFRCETHPHEVSALSADARGETILHWTCLGKPPLDTVQAVLRASPELARMRNNVGHLPLHVAISYRSSVGVVRALLEVFPESAGLPNGAGSYPLHLLCDYGSCVDSLRAVLETTGGAATISKRIQGTRPGTLDNRHRHTTPLNLLNARMDYPQFQRALAAMRDARRQQQAIQQEMLQRKNVQAKTRQQQNTITENENSNALGDNQSTQEDPLAVLIQQYEQTIASFQTNDYWQKASLLVMVEYTQQPLAAEAQQQEEQAKLMVHACAGIPSCPSFLLEFAVVMHADALLHRKDAQGRLPLHVAAVNHVTALGLDPSKKEHQRYQETSERTLRAVLQACPQAAEVQDDNGDLPLRLALRHAQINTLGGSNTKAWSSGLQQLLDANLQVLETLDLGEKLLPYVWAKRVKNADSLFQSIRQHPNMFRSRR